MLGARAPAVVERIRGGTAVSVQVLVCSEPSPVFVRRSGIRGTRREAPTELGWWNYCLSSYPTSVAHSDFSRKG
jgi:hypothetical protein